MWVPQSLASLFIISRDTLTSLREEVASLKGERDTLRFQVVAHEGDKKWLISRLNALELERASLLEKVYGIRVPAPEVILGAPRHKPVPTNFAELFEDMGDAKAKELGLPVYQA